MRQILILVPVFAAGLLLGAWALSGSDEASHAAAVQPGAISAEAFEQAGEYERLEQMIDSLTEILNFEVSERRRLEVRLDEMTEQLASLGASRPAARVSRTETNVRAKESAARNSMRGRGGIGQASEQRFVDAGFSPDVASQLKRQLDEIEMERLYLRDEAVRDGWLGSKRYRDSLRELTAKQNNIRTELSPTDYDRYLYALGRPNRINVDSVLSGSPADQSGLRTGDQILSYGGTRVFTPGEIRRATSGGTRGEMVAVEVLRDGQPQVIYVPRGPLGVQMGSAVTKP